MLIYIDFEYNKSMEMRRNLVSVSLATPKGKYTSWLYEDPKSKKSLVKFLKKKRKEKAIFVAFNVEAEAGSFISLGLDPTTFRWIDLQKEWKMLCNHWDKYTYGKQLINGRVVVTHNSVIKRELTRQEAKKKKFNKPESNMAAAVFKMCGVQIDTERKNRVRDIIIHMTEEPSEEIKQEILKYNESDVDVLPTLWANIKEALKSGRAPIKSEEILYRGSIAAHEAVITCRGYPISKTIINFAANTGKILSECAEDINSQFPELGVFQFNKPTGRYTLKQKPLKEFVKSTDAFKNWEKTATGDVSLKLEAWNTHFPFRSPYPRDNFPAQIIRYLKLKQSLNGFMPVSKNAKKKDNFFSSLGKDYRCRPYLNSYGSQSSRFQPKATSYIPLKSSWMRYFIQPKRGTAICGIDYKSQEFLIAGLLSGDQGMIEAYKSGDVYLDFGKRAKIIPSDAGKDHPLRNMCKSSVLGIQYLMGAESLGRKITMDTGIFCSTEKAEQLISAFKKAYPVYDQFRYKTIRDYERKKYLKLSDGWVMYGDNGNFRSVANCPVQGAGAVVLRKIIVDCHANHLKFILPLHDAGYIEITHQAEVDIFKEVMRDAFIESFPNNPDAKHIMLDTYAWGVDAKKIITDKSIPVMDYYITDRSKAEFDRFKKYFIIGES